MNDGRGSVSRASARKLVVKPARRPLTQRDPAWKGGDDSVSLGEKLKSPTADPRYSVGTLGCAGTSVASETYALLVSSRRSRAGKIDDRARDVGVNPQGVSVSFRKHSAKSSTTIPVAHQQALPGAGGCIFTDRTTRRSSR